MEKLELSFVSGVCIGLEKVISEGPLGKYSEVVCNTILPDTDEEYEAQKKEIEGRMKRFAASSEMYDLLKRAQDFFAGYDSPLEREIKELINKINS